MPFVATHEIDILDVAWVQEHTHRGAKCSRGNVVAELRAHNTVVAVRPGNTTPDHTVLLATGLVRGLVDVGNTLAKVELGVLGVFDTLNLDQRHVGVHRALAAPVTHDPALAVKTRLRQVSMSFTSTIIRQKCAITTKPSVGTQHTLYAA